ncbi:MAG: hypothetical protein LBD41_00215 [Clostridiales Family XIII bacterium]|nr:hypothetical protein [Clostridiales Family XIII bacterium]
MILVLIIELLYKPSHAKADKRKAGKSNLRQEVFRAVLVSVHKFIKMF